MSSAVNNDPRLQAAATHLADARRLRQPCARVSESCALTDLEEAYAVQTLGVQEAIAQGRGLSGGKAGLTSAALRAALKVAEPLYGWLHSDMACQSGDSIAWERLLQPKVELELALVVAKDLPVGELSEAQFVECLAGVAPALEINDSAITGWQLTLLDAVADNLSSGLYVLAAQTVPIAQAQAQALRASFYKNAEAQHRDVPLSLTDSLATGLWLARKRNALGAPLKAGDVLLTGALVPIADLARGDCLRFAVDGLGEVSCSFV